jgi:histone-lysine N-methyltransferase SETMAR
MSEEKIAIRALLRHYWKKGLSTRAAVEQICEVEGPEVVSQSAATRWFNRFNNGDTSLENKSRSGRPSTTDNEALRELVEQQPGTSTRRLSAELGPSQPTIVRHLHQLGFENRRPRVMPHELTNQQAKRRVDLCSQLLANPMDIRFWRRIVTGDEKWIYFRNPDKGNQWLQPGQAAEPVVQRGRFEHKVMLCIWWNFEGPLHWELVPDGRAMDANLYAEQLQRVHQVLCSRYPAMVNRKRALLQHDNAPVHTSRRVQQKIQELEGIELLPHPAYSPDLAPSDFHLFRSLAHFLRGRCFNSVQEVKNGVREFLASKPAEWYRHGIEQLAERWTRTIESDGLYFEE